MHRRYNPDYIHHQDSRIVSAMREIVFGMEDGMVSTLGAITGIAVGSQDQYTVILAGSVIIAVESISMGMGSFISSSSEKEIVKRKLFEESEEIKTYPTEEKEELKEMYIEDGWPEDLAEKMSSVAIKNHDLVLQEMAYRELKINPQESSKPLKDGIYMFFAYIVGGLIPLIPYFILPIKIAVFVSVPLTLLGLFALGAGTTRYTKGKWLRKGLYMLLLGGTALLAGYLIGKLATLL